MSKRSSSSIVSGRQPKHVKHVKPTCDITTKAHVSALKSMLAITWILTRSMEDVRLLYNMYVNMCDTLNIDRMSIFGYDKKSGTIRKQTISALVPLGSDMAIMDLTGSFTSMVDTIKTLIDITDEYNANIQNIDVCDDADFEPSNCLTVLADSFTSHDEYIYDGPHGIPKHLHNICTSCYAYECDSETSDRETTDDDCDMPSPLQESTDEGEDDDDNANLYA